MPSLEYGDGIGKIYYSSILMVGVLTIGYSNIVKLLVEISILKHAKYNKTVTSKYESILKQ